MTPTVTTPDWRPSFLRLLARNWQDGSAVGPRALAYTVHPSVSEPLKPECDCGQCLTCWWLAYRNGLPLAEDILLNGTEVLTP